MLTTLENRDHFFGKKELFLKTRTIFKFLIFWKARTILKMIKKMRMRPIYEIFNFFFDNFEQIFIFSKKHKLNC